MEEGKIVWEQFRETFTEEAVQLSSFSSYALRTDMKHFIFCFSRYKFAAKMLKNKPDLTMLELGCNDGLGTLLIKQETTCKKIIGVDFDSHSIQWAQKNIADENLCFIEDDFLNKTYVRGGG